MTLRCDFGFDHGEPTWIYPCRSTEVHTLIINPDTGKSGSYTQFNNGDWCACDPCHAVIETGRLTRDFAYQTYRDFPEPAREAVWVGWDAFLKQRTGPGIPITPKIRAQIEPEAQASIDAAPESMAAIHRLAREVMDGKDSDVDDGPIDAVVSV